MNTAQETKAANNDIMGAGSFWFKCIFNPEYLRFSVSFHSMLFICLGITEKLLSHSKFDFPKIHGMHYLWGGISFFMAVFSILLTAAMARAIVEQKTLAPKGFTGVNIASISAGTIPCFISAFINLYVLRFY